MPGLGRLVDHDERSRFFQAPIAHAKRSVLWGHHAPVLDQGNLGSCTGNAAAQLLNCDVFAKSRRSAAYLAEPDAVKLYSLATQLDGIQGNEYPPVDGGSSGLGVAKAGVKLGYFSGYRHAFGFDHFCATLQTQPVLVGTGWTAKMFKPSSKGVVRPLGKVVGGHEYLALGVSYETRMLTFLNSWGDKWGVGGRFFMSFDDFALLLNQQGDAVAPVGAN